MKIPLFFSIMLIETPDDADLWELAVSVPDQKKSQTSAVIRYAPAKSTDDISIERITQVGLNALSQAELSGLLISVFTVAYARTVRSDGKAIGWVVSDCTGLLTRRLEPQVAASICRVLASFVDPHKKFLDMAVGRLR